MSWLPSCVGDVYLSVCVIVLYSLVIPSVWHGWNRRRIPSCFAQKHQSSHDLGKVAGEKKEQISGANVRALEQLLEKYKSLQPSFHGTGHRLSGVNTILNLPLFFFKLQRAFDA